MKIHGGDLSVEASTVSFLDFSLPLFSAWFRYGMVSFSVEFHPHFYDLSLRYKDLALFGCRQTLRCFLAAVGLARKKFQRLIKLG